MIAPQRAIPRRPKRSQKSAIEQAFEFRRLLDGGVVNSQAEIAERLGISRARVTQVLNLLKLPQAVLSLLADSGDTRWSERRLRGVLALPSHEDQVAAVRAMAREPPQTES
jgi:ParB/RepB/Spo0J family partition protein